MDWQPRPLGRMPQSQLSPEQGQPAPHSCPRGCTVAWGQPGTRSRPQEDLQTQDWEKLLLMSTEQEELSRWYRSLTLAISGQSQGISQILEFGTGQNQEYRGVFCTKQSTLRGLTRVCEPPERRRPARHWSLSIDERRQLAVLGARERRDAGAPSLGRDITQIVAEPVSEDPDKDVLLPNPPRSAASTNAFHDVLTRSAPLWQDAAFQARTPGSPPS